MELLIHGTDEMENENKHGTVTEIDYVDEFQYEKLWEDGNMNSKACL